MKKAILIFLSILFVYSLSAQDKRTLDTKVADLLARMPVYNETELGRQMAEMNSMGTDGRMMILKELGTAGTGDDTRARFAIESYSRYLSDKEDSKEKTDWEKEIISAVRDMKEVEPVSFLFTQLNYIGGLQSAELASDYISDAKLCEPAVAVLASINSDTSDKILSDALKEGRSPAIASIINALAARSYSKDIGSFLSLAASSDAEIKKAALNALAESGSADAYSVLTKAASATGYKWERTEATASLIRYAEVLASKGGSKNVEKICKQLISKGQDHYRIAALALLASCEGVNAEKYMISAFKKGDKKVRMALLNMPSAENMSEAWLNVFVKAGDEQKAEIISVLGEKKEMLLAPFLGKTLFDHSSVVRIASAKAVAALGGKDALTELISYIRSYATVEDQMAGYTAIMTIIDDEGRVKIVDALEGSDDLTVGKMLMILGNSGENKYFETIYRYTGSENSELRKIACESLGQVASADDQEDLVELLMKLEEEDEISDIQTALSVAAAQDKDNSFILREVNKAKDKDRLFPVLASLGGSDALKTVLAGFEEGDAETRVIAYQALTDWVDHEASSALFEICTSGNKTYASKAFDGYVKQISGARLPEDQLLLLLRKIMPYASSVEQKINVIEELAGVHSFISLIYTSQFLEEADLRQAAARSLMSIALPRQGSETGLYGAEVRIILEQVAEALEGEESDYDRARIMKYIESLPEETGFVSMFDGESLDGWEGLVENPIARSKMSKSELAEKQREADKKMLENWSVKDNAIWFSGKGANLCSVKDYGDFELYVDWKITKKGDSGIYLRGTPQVQIWDTSRVEVGAQVGSGGLYNNQKNESKPLVVADNPIGDWNTFRIVMIGERVSVWLNGILVVDDVVMENYWDRSQPIFPSEAIELQAHGNELAFRDIWVREINEDEYMLTPEEKADGFVSLFNGSDLDNWLGNRGAYVAEDGMIVVKQKAGSGGNLYTENEYSDFNFRFEFQLTPGANNGLGIRAPLEGDAAYLGMELQILDNTADIYANLQPYQYHGSVYGVIPAKRGFLRPLGEWNEEEVIVRGTHIQVILNGEVIVDGDIADARDNGTMDHRDHPGLKNDKGHIGFLGHGSELKFRNIRIKDLSE